MYARNSVTIKDLQKVLKSAPPEASEWPVMLVANNIKMSVRATLLHGVLYITPVHDYGMGFTVDIKQLPDDEI